MLLINAGRRSRRGRRIFRFEEDARLDTRKIRFTHIRIRSRASDCLSSFLFNRQPWHVLRSPWALVSILYKKRLPTLTILYTCPAYLRPERWVPLSREKGTSSLSLFHSRYKIYRCPAWRLVFNLERNDEVLFPFLHKYRVKKQGESRFYFTLFFLTPSPSVLCPSSMCIFLLRSSAKINNRPSDLR